jgi:hypothetical protein
MSDESLRLGEVLIEAGVLKPEQLEAALALQKKRQLRLGTILLQERFVTEPQLVQALSRRLSIPWVNLWHIDIADKLLQLVPASVAEEFFLIPIYIRTTSSGEKILFVAMNDPTDDAALRFVAASSGMAVKPMIAGPSDISAAIRFYYYGEESEEPENPPLPPTSSQPPQSLGRQSRSIPPPTPRPSGQPTPVGSIPPPPPAQAASKQNGEPSANTEYEAEKKTEDQLEKTVSELVDSNDSGSEASVDPAQTKNTKSHADLAQEGADKQQAQREIEKHMFGVGGGKHRKAVSLTLLDGTTIDFGGAAKKQPPTENFTRQDLIAGLRAAAQGTPIEGFLPSDRWEDYMAALLSVLMRKHLVMFDELMDEIKKKKA